MRRLNNTSMMNDYPHLYRGKVLDNKDPKNLGRCKIYVPSIYGSEQEAYKDYLPWARCMSTLPVTSDRGSAYVPSVDDIVWVIFEGGNRDAPVYIGGTHGSSDTPVDINTVVLYQEGFVKDENSGEKGLNVIKYDRKNHIFTIKMDNNLIDIHKDNHINIHSEDDINITAKKVVNIKSEETVNVEAKNVNVKSSETTTIEASKNVNVKASDEVKVEGSTKVYVKSTDIELEGNVKIKGNIKMEGGIDMGSSGNVSFPSNRNNVHCPYAHVHD